VYWLLVVMVLVVRGDVREWLLTFPFPPVPVPIHAAVEFYITTVHYCRLQVLQYSTVRSLLGSASYFKFRHMVPLVF